MILRRATLEGIRDGQVEVAFRRWARPRVVRGTRRRTALGVVEVTAVEIVAEEAIDDDAARRAGFSGRDALLRSLAKREGGAIHRIELRWAGEDPRVALRRRADLSDDEFAEIRGRLERMDRGAAGGPWTRTTLLTIRDRPATRAPDLAESLGRETPPFKRDVRKLKELGLTESLEVGYRLSPRGEVVLAALG